jgi:hypothetical protein
MKKSLEQCDSGSNVWDAVNGKLLSGFEMAVLILHLLVFLLPKVHAIEKKRYRNNITILCRLANL